MPGPHRKMVKQEESATVSEGEGEGVNLSELNSLSSCTPGNGHLQVAMHTEGEGLRPPLRKGTLCMAVALVLASSAPFAHGTIVSAALSFPIFCFSRSPHTGVRCFTNNENDIRALPQNTTSIVQCPETHQALSGLASLHPNTLQFCLLFDVFTQKNHSRKRRGKQKETHTYTKTKAESRAKGREKCTFC